MYLVTNANGDVELEIDSDKMADVKEAVDGVFPKHTSIYTVADPAVEEMEKHAKKMRMPNPPGSAPAHAMKISGLPWDEKRGVGLTMADVLAKYPLTKDGLAAAHKALLKYFPNQPDQFGYKEWRTPMMMAAALLKSNTKTKKAVEGVGIIVPPSFAVGINIMPFALGAMQSELSARAQTDQYLKDPKNRERPVKFVHLPFVAPKVNGTGMRKMDWSKERPQGLCAGSTDLCRKTCLVFTGQNGAVAYNDVSKLMTERALFFEPVAFCRMLMESIEFHYRYCKKQGLKPFVRLNVYSDIPWELLFPDLFHHFEAKYGHNINAGGLWFYDYTKVGGRSARPMPNYDLTFSYSGGNLPQVREALHRDMRAAVVFLRQTASGSKKTLFEVSLAGVRGKKERFSAMMEEEAMAMYRAKHPGKARLAVSVVRGPTYKAAESVTDLIFEGAPVIDGDPYDMRPLDPTNVVVGLRFKVPRRLEQKTGESRRESAAGAGGAFVLAPPKHDEKFLVHATRLDKQWFFTQVTPGQTNVNVATQLNSEESRQNAAE